MIFSRSLATLRRWRDTFYMTTLIKRASAEARAFRISRNNARHAAAASDDAIATRSRNTKRTRAQNDDLDAAPKIDAPRKPRYAPVTFSEEDGVRYLHFGTEWVQGAMRLKKPHHIELEYAQQMMAWLLFLATPARIVQLGGEPDFAPQTLAQRAHSEYREGTDLTDMIRENLVAERIAIETYRAIIRFLGDSDTTTRRIFEEILAVEEEHADDMTDLLDK